MDVFTENGNVPSVTRFCTPTVVTVTTVGANGKQRKMM